MASRDDIDFDRLMRELPDVRPLTRGGKKGSAAGSAAQATPRMSDGDEGASDELDFDKLMRELPDVGRPGRAPTKGATGAAGSPDPEPDSIVARAPIAVTSARDARYAATPEERSAFLAAVEEVAAPKERASSTPVGTPDVERIVRLVRRGQTEPDATIDLHGMTRQRALSAIETFVGEARAEKWRVVRVVVGKGLHSAGGDAVVGPTIERWLRDGPALEVVKAPTHLGGSGALLVVLRLE